MTYNAGMEMRMDLYPWAVPLPKSKSNIRVLDEFPGFDEFYAESIKPTIMKNSHKNIVIVIVGEAGVGKETIEGMLMEKMVNDMEVLGWQEEQNFQLKYYSSEWSDCFNFAPNIIACFADGEKKPIVNPWKANGKFKENHEYSIRDYDRLSDFWKHNLLHYRRVLKSAVIFVESVALVPDSLTLELRGLKGRERVNLGFNAIRALARMANTFFIGVVTNDDVQARARQFRKELAVATPEDIPYLLKKYHLRVDKDIQDIAEDVEGFRRRMGTAEAITIIRKLVDEEIFFLTQDPNLNIREAVLKALDYSLPRNLADLKMIFDSVNYPGRRAKALNFYLHYLFEEIFRLPSDRYLIGENKFLNEKIYLYRKNLEARTLPLFWLSRWGKFY